MTREDTHANGDAGGGRRRLIVLAVVGVVFAAVLGAKFGSARDSASRGGPGPSSARVDAAAVYDAARRQGKPAYILFHSTTCQSCVELSAVVDDVVPGYDGEVVFVNALTDDAGSKTLASRFPFQYIPASFFVSAEGVVSEPVIGPMTARQMRSRLDRLTGR